MHERRKIPEYFSYPNVVPHNSDTTYKKHRRVVGPRGTREAKLTRNSRAHFYI